MSAATGPSSPAGARASDTLQRSGKETVEAFRKYPLHAGIAAAALAATDVPAAAQSTTTWRTSVEGEAIYRFGRDLDRGGDFSSTRLVAGVSGRKSFGGPNGVGISFSAATTDYRFGGIEAPWGRINEFSLAAPVTLALGGAATAVVVPIARFRGEDGTDFDDGLTGGAVAAASWRFSETFSMGPGVGVFTTLEGRDDFEVFPILLVDWQISEQWSIGNGEGFGATRGPGIGVRYQPRPDFSTQLFVRLDSAEFRLDDTGPAPGGVGEDKVTSVVASAAYRPGDAIDVSAFAGVELGGRLTLRDADGMTVDRRDYDPAPLIGARISVQLGG